MRAHATQIYFSPSQQRFLAVELSFDDVHGENPYEIAREAVALGLHDGTNGSTQARNEYYDSCRPIFAIYEIDQVHTPATLHEAVTSVQASRLLRIRETNLQDFRGTIIRELQAEANSYWHQSLPKVLQLFKRPDERLQRDALTFSAMACMIKRAVGIRNPIVNTRGTSTSRDAEVPQVGPGLPSYTQSVNNGVQVVPQMDLPPSYEEAMAQRGVQDSVLGH